MRQLLLFTALPLFTPLASAKVLILPTSNGCTHLEEIARLARQLDFPDGWRIQVVCDANTWLTAQHRFDAFQTDTGFTNLPNRFTMIYDVNFQPRVLRHERGHIACNCKDEQKAEAWANLHR